MPQHDIDAIKIPVIAGFGSGTGDGGTDLKHGTVARTSGEQPNLVVVIVTPIVAILVRFVHAYLSALIGLVVAGGSTHLIPWTDFWDLVQKSATLALAGPCLEALKDVATIFGNLSRKFPLLTGNV